MTSFLDSHTTTDLKLDMLSGAQTENGILHDEYNIRGTAHARTKTTFSCKDDSRKALHIYWSGGKGQANTALDIFHFEVFSLLGPTMILFSASASVLQ